MYLQCRLYFLALTCLTGSLFISSCSPQKNQNDLAKTSSDQLTESQKAQLEALVNQQLEKRDAEGNIEELKGFKTSDNLGKNTNLQEDQGFQELIENDEQVFEFVPPDGIEAEFSEPVMINGGSLFLANNLNDLIEKCQDLAYQPEEPTMKEILEYSQKTNTCGEVTVNFCIRLKMANSIDPDNPSYTYTESPDLNLNLPCPGDSFNDLSFTIANGQSHTSNDKEKINIKALISVISVYLTNTPGCLEGGEWQYIGREDPEWPLSFDEQRSATVYAKFKDVFDEESYCLSDSISYGSTADQCFEDDPNYLAENILVGVSIGELEGRASLSYPICTSDGQTNCIANNDFKAQAANSIAGKVLNTYTVGGINGEAAPETRTNCDAGGQEGCITTATYVALDLSSQGAGGATNLTSDMFLARIKSASTLEFWNETGNRYTASGDANIVAANILNSADVFGVTGTAGASPDCSSIPAELGTWVLVPGDATYGTKDFCVMKYEAKCSNTWGDLCTIASDSPISQAANTPWTEIDQRDAKTECASLGKGYHLITNDEWMTIAANIAAQASNWSGSIGTSNLTGGIRTIRQEHPVVQIMMILKLM